MVDYPTLDTHKEQLQSRRYELLSAEIKRVHLSALENAWTYFVDVEVMRNVQASKAYMNFEKPLWIELSEPMKDEVSAGYRLPLFKSVVVAEGLDIYREVIYKWEWNADTGNIAAMLFYNPLQECMRLGIEIPSVTNWRLLLITKDGYLSSFFPYNAKEEKWINPFIECEHAKPNICERCSRAGEHYLNTWKKRFRQALVLIQKNRYRPGNIPVIH